MKSLRIIFILIVLAGCRNNTQLSEQELKDYKNQINDWHQQRESFLKSEEGWLNLAGLFWLEPGINTIGAANTNDIQFPEGALPEKAGYLLLENGTVTCHFLKDILIQIDN